MARMRDYIAGNPARWAEDTENPNHLKKKDDAVGRCLLRTLACEMERTNERGR